MSLQELCLEKHKHIDEKFDNLGQTVQGHEERISKIENSQIRTETIVQNLCSQIQSLISVLKWSIGVLVTTGIGFIIWYIQTLRH